VGPKPALDAVNKMKLFTLDLFEPWTVQSVATHNTDCTPHLKYLSTAQYRDEYRYDHRSVTCCQ